MTLMDFAKDDAEAEGRADTWEERDPFQTVPHGLLSSAEVHDYARVTAMLYPFYPTALKSASYEAHIGGQCVFWNEKGERQDRFVKRGGDLVLRANSITFVQVEPEFRLPNYIALRFNLRITHVHRGLLLGTGPLVDPGFRGKLLIPLHNLTSTDYDLNTDKALIWIEFTKTTFGCIPKEPEAEPDRKAHFFGFPKSKRGISPDAYLRKANGSLPIQSSIPQGIALAASSAEEAAKSAKDASRTATAIGIGGGIAAVIAIGGILAALGIGLHSYFGQIQSLVTTSNTLSEAVAGRLDALQYQLGEETAQSNTVSKQVDDLADAIATLRRQLEQLERKLEAKPNAPTQTSPQ